MKTFEKQFNIKTKLETLDQYIKSILKKFYYWIVHTKKKQVNTYLFEIDFSRLYDIKTLGFI